MRLLIFSTRSRATASWLAEELAPLEAHQPQVGVVLLSRPAERLPVDRCLIVGMSLRPFRSIRVKGGEPNRLSALDRALIRWVPERWSEDRSLMFATGTVGSRGVARMFREADIVIATDWNATWAAWLLAKRIPGPEVVHGVAGALRKVSGPDHNH